MGGPSFVMPNQPEQLLPSTALTAGTTPWLTSQGNRILILTPSFNRNSSPRHSRRRGNPERPRPRHSRRSGNPEPIVCENTVEIADTRRAASCVPSQGCCGKGLWIPAAARMTGGGGGDGFTAEGADGAVTVQSRWVNISWEGRLSSCPTNLNNYTGISAGDM